MQKLSDLTVDEFYELFCDMLLRDDDTILELGRRVADTVSQEIARDISDGRYTL